MPVVTGPDTVWLMGADTERAEGGRSDTGHGAGTGTGAGERGNGPGRGPRPERYVPVLAVLGAIAVLVSNLGGIATGDDGVGYRAIADSLLAGDGLRYFLEDPLTVWPPLWPAAMALIARVTPLDTVGAAIVLNAAMTAAAVVVGHRLLRRVVGDARLVLLGTTVIALGASTIGFGHLLMTDFAFAVVLMLWTLALLNHRDAVARDAGARGSGGIGWLLAAAGWVWVGFGLRYVAIVIVATGGLWLLLSPGRRVVLRVRDAALYGVAAAVVPAAWMLRNHSLDGTWTGPRYPSARGPIGNTFDVVATMGRFLLPGVQNDRAEAWALVAVVVLAVAAFLAWRVLATRTDREGAVPGQVVRLLGGPSGLLLLQAALYLLYMIYIRSTTALNQLDLRLLNPAYLPLVVLGLVLVARLRDVPPPGRSREFRFGWAAAHVWAVANVALGIVAVVAFALGNSFFPGNYESDTFDAVRDNAALDALPEDCAVVSNLPNALYPELEAEWSPRRTGLESDEPVDDLQQLVPTLDDDPTCLVWIDEDPTYGHLWSLGQLQDRLTVTELATDGDVSVYRLAPPA